MGNNPFQTGAACSKDELLQGIKRPSSDDWTGLAASMWIRKSLDELSDDHPSRAGLLRQLQENDCFSSNVPKPLARHGIERKDSCAPDVVPTTELITIDEHHTLDEHDCLTPTDDDEAPSTHASDAASITSFQPSNTFNFDLREQSGGRAFQRWMNERPDLANPVRKICVQHWTWIYNDEESKWFAIDDETVMSLLSSGKVHVTRSKSHQYPRMCLCDGAPHTGNDYHERSDPWSMTDFAQALAQDDSQLIHIASKFLSLIQEHDETYQPIPCRQCRKTMFHLRIYRQRAVDPTLVPRPLRISRSPLPPPIPAKSSCRASRSYSPVGRIPLHASKSTGSLSPLGNASIITSIASVPSLFSQQASRSVSGSTTSSTYSATDPAPPTATCHSDTYDILNSFDDHDLISPISSISSRIPSLRLEIPITPTFAPAAANTSPLLAFPYSDFREGASPRSAMSELREYPWLSSAESVTGGTKSGSSPGLKQRISKRFSSINVRGRYGSSSPTSTSTDDVSVSVSDGACSSPATTVSMGSWPASPVSSAKSKTSLLKGRLDSVVEALRRK